MNETLTGFWKKKIFKFFLLSFNFEREFRILKTDFYEWNFNVDCLISSFSCSDRFVRICFLKTCFSFDRSRISTRFIFRSRPFTKIRLGGEEGEKVLLHFKSSLTRNLNCSMKKFGSKKNSGFEFCNVSKSNASDREKNRSYSIFIQNITIIHHTLNFAFINLSL